MEGDQRRRLLLAYAISTYGGMAESMLALREAGQPVGYGTLGAVRRSLIGFAQEWDVMHGTHLWRADRLPTIVEEARVYCAEHQEEVDTLEAGHDLRIESE